MVLRDRFPVLLCSHTDRNTPDGNPKGNTVENETPRRISGKTKAMIAGSVALVGLGAYLGGADTGADTVIPAPSAPSFSLPTEETTTAPVTPVTPEVAPVAPQAPAPVPTYELPAEAPVTAYVTQAPAETVTVTVPAEPVPAATVTETVTKAPEATQTAPEPTADESDPVVIGGPTADEPGKDEPQP